MTIETVTITSKGTTWTLEPTPTGDFRLISQHPGHFRVDYLTPLAAVRFSHSMGKNGSRLANNY